MLNDATSFKRVFLKVGYTDLRRGIDGLAAVIQQEFQMDPFEEGTLFLFCGRRTDRIKALCYEGDGFLLLYKPLAKERRRSKRDHSAAIQMADGWTGSAAGKAHTQCEAETCSVDFWDCKAG